MNVRIVFVIKGLVVEGGGAERVLVDIANELSRRGHILDVLTFDKPGQSCFYPLANRVTVHPIGSNTPGMPTRLKDSLALLVAIRRSVAAINPDIVVGFMHSSFVLVAAALLGTGRKLIVSEHTSAQHYKNRPIQAAAAALADFLAVAKTVPSQTVYEEQPERVSGKVHVLLNPLAPIDAELVGFDRVRRANTILCVGRFWAEKGHSTLLRAFARLAGDFDDWTLRFAGDGKLRPAIEREIASLKLFDRVALPGMVRDVAAEYDKCTFLVMPSRYESFGLVAAEALSRGRPVIGFADCKGACELIRDGENGLLVEPGTDRVLALAQAMRRLMEDQELTAALAANAYSSVRHLDLSSIGDDWERVLRESIK